MTKYNLSLFFGGTTTGVATGLGFYGSEISSLGITNITG